MKIDRPLDQLREIFRASNRESKELLKYVFEKSDNISLWIIGLSIGGISIFANNIADIQKVISLCYLRPILLLLAISVTSGIIYRGLYLYFFVVMNNTLRGIDIAFSNSKSMDTESNLTGKETFKELVDKVNDGFGDDLSYLLPAFENIDEKARVEVYKSVVDHYLKSLEFAQQDEDRALDFVADTYSNFFGMNKEKFLRKIKSPEAGGANQYRWTLVLTTIFYFIYILTFIAALFCVCFVKPFCKIQAEDKGQHKLDDSTYFNKKS